MLLTLMRPHMQLRQLMCIGHPRQLMTKFHPSAVSTESHFPTLACQVTVAYFSLPTNAHTSSAFSNQHNPLP